MVYCEECKWFGVHFLSDASGNVTEHPVCLNGLWLDESDHICSSYERGEYDV